MHYTPPGNRSQTGQQKEPKWLFSINLTFFDRTTFHIIPF